MLCLPLFAASVAWAQTSEEEPAAEAETETEDGPAAAPADQAPKAAPQQPAVAPVDEHAATPSGLRDRLSILASASLGTGLHDRMDSDFLGVSLATHYAWSGLASQAQQTSRGFLSMRYASHTSVETRASRDVVVQRFLLGAGIDWSSSERPWSYGAAVEIGLFKAASAAIRRSDVQDSDYGLSLGVQPYVSWRVVPKVALTGGLDLSPGFDQSWYGLNIGTALLF